MCVVRFPWEQNPDVAASADQSAAAVDLDVSAYWVPTARSYFARAHKALILAAVREAVGSDAAERLAGMKKPAMAESAEHGGNRLAAPHFVLSHIFE